MSDLLKPRYKVIGDFWDNPFKVGDIIEMTGKSRRFPIMGENNVDNWEVWVDTEGGGAMCYSIEKFQPYPHLFKPLAWWQERKPEEMPEYVKEEGGVIRKVQYKIQNFRYLDKEVLKMYDSEVSWMVCAGVMEFYEPATKAEYDNYIKNNL